MDPCIGLHYPPLPGSVGPSSRGALCRDSVPSSLRQVVALTLLTAAGEILECSEGSHVDIFQAARVHLGCLGVVLTITFQCVPEFYLQETTFPSTLKEVPSGWD